MPIRISLCRNAGANRGKIVSSVVLKDSSSVDDIAKIARNKLKIPKKKQVVLYEHNRGTQIVDSNWKQFVTNGTLLNVSCGEAFLSPQGIAIATGVTREVPKPPRWPAPFGREEANETLDETTEQTIASPGIDTDLTLPIVYVDLDGVLADFDRGCMDLCGQSPSQLPSRTLWQAIDGADNFFGSLEWTNDGEDLFNALLDMFGEGRIEILSACPNKFAAQKRRWCATHLGNIKVHICSQSTKKPKWSRVGCMLIDDNLDLKAPWESHGGTFVHHKTARDTLAILQRQSSHRMPGYLRAESSGQSTECAWPDRCVQFVSLVVDPTDFRSLLMAEHFPATLKKTIETPEKASWPHVTLAHMRQISQKDMLDKFGGLCGETVAIEVGGVLWNQYIAALEVQVSEKSSSGATVPRSLNEFVHITIWRKLDVKPAEANDLPQQVAKGHAKAVRFEQPVRLLTTLTYGDESLMSRTESIPADRLRSPFADLSGDVLNYYKRLARTNKYIALRRHDEHISLDYTDVAAFQGDDGRDLKLQECRGLLLSPYDGTVLARRFHKFYNINIHEVSNASDLDIRGGLLMEKLDGFLVSPFVSPVSSQVHWATRQERCTEVEELVSSLVDCGYGSFVQYWMNQQCTPLFECILRRRHKGIVSYDEDRLVVLAIRNNSTGLYVDWDEAVSSANRFNVPVARTIRKVGDDETLDDILNFVRNQLSTAQQIEGVVLVLADGQGRYKIKTNWYLNHTNLRSAFESKKARSDLQVFSWKGLSSSHWSDIPNHYFWEVALWDWLSNEGTACDDFLPVYIDRLHQMSHCPVNVLLYFIQETRRNLVQLDQELAIWSSDDCVQSNKDLAYEHAKEAGWDLNLIQTYWVDSEQSLRALAKFLWQKCVKKSEWDAVRSVLHQPFVGISELSTDTQRLLDILFPDKNLQPVTVILRGLPSSGKSHFANHILAPYFTESVEIFSADDFFVQNGVYKFNESQLAEAHADCRNRFEKSTAVVRVIDNTNSTLAEYSYYKRKSQRCVVLEIRGRGAAKQNNHTVPQFKVDRMKHRWETDKLAVPVENFRA